MTERFCSSFKEYRLRFSVLTLCCGRLLLKRPSDTSHSAVFNLYFLTLESFYYQGIIWKLKPLMVLKIGTNWVRYQCGLSTVEKSCVSSEAGGGTAAAAPPPFRPSDPALCGSRPVVTSYYYCRLGNLQCFLFMSGYCMFDFSVYYLYLQYFDTGYYLFWFEFSQNFVRCRRFASRRTQKLPSKYTPGTLPGTQVNTR